MMSEALFQRLAAEQSWPPAEQIDILLRYITHQASPDAFADFLDQQCERAGDITGDSDTGFIWAVIGHLGDPGLADCPAFRRYCAAGRRSMTPRLAAERWCRWQVA